MTYTVPRELLNYSAISTSQTFPVKKTLDSSLGQACTKFTEPKAAGSRVPIRDCIPSPAELPEELLSPWMVLGENSAPLHADRLTPRGRRTLALPKYMYSAPQEYLEYKSNNKTKPHGQLTSSSLPLFTSLPATEV